jgi:pimeloyl-ACP methyl ester carboxylesterase
MMLADFLPPTAANLTEAESMAMSQWIERVPVFLPQLDRSVATSVVSQGQERDKPPIVLLHGFDSSLLEFRRLLPLLSPEYRVWAIDLLGFGFTERSLDVDYSPASIAMHLDAWWQQSIDRPIILVGASMGGAAALEFTLAHPERVEKLILIDSVGCTNPPQIGKFLFPPLTTLATKFLSTPKVRHNISIKAYYNPIFATADADLCASLHLEMPHWSEALISFTRSGGYGGLRDRLPEISTKTLIIWGEADRIIGRKPADIFAKSLPNSQLVLVPNAGHVPHLESSLITAKSILDFLSV